jgi:Cdc6-like AAA superfamily ATPase
MSLEITQYKNNKLKIMNSENNLDKELSNDLPEPLPNYSGFLMVIAGAPGSGKTTLLTSLMTSKKKNGKRQSYRKLFDKIIIVSPTLGNGKSMKNDPFTDIRGEQKFKEFNLETIDEIMNMLEKNRDDDLKTVIIFDDVGSQIRKSQLAEKKLINLCQNRRHLFCSIFFLVQKWKDLGTGIRSSMSHFITFRPKNNMEMESIMQETMPYKKNCWQQIMNYIFDNKDKFSFFMIDMSLKETNKYRYFNKFDEMIINEIC